VCRPRYHGATQKGTSPNFSQSGVWKNWLRAYKTANISEIGQNRAKVTINCLPVFIVTHGVQIKAVDNRRLVSSSLDQTVTVWKQDDGKHLTFLRGNCAMSNCPFSIITTSTEIK